MVSQGHMLADVVAIIGKFLLSYNFGITPKIPPHVLLEFSFVVPICFNRSSGQNLLKYQLDSSCVIRPSILMTTVFYKAVILQREI